MFLLFYAAIVQWQYFRFLSHGVLCRHFRSLRSIHDSILCEKDGLNEDVFSIIGRHVIIIFWTQ